MFTTSIDWSGGQKISKKNPCPACGKPNWCSFDRTGNFLSCRRPNIANFNPLGWDFVKETEPGAKILLKRSGLRQETSNNTV